MWWYLEDSFGILVVIRHTVVGKNSFILFFFISFKLYVCKFHCVRFVDHSLFLTIINLMDMNNPKCIKF